MKKVIHITILLIVTIPLVVYGFTDGQILMSTFNGRFPVPTAEDLDRGYLDIQFSNELSSQIDNQRVSQWNMYISTDQPYFTPVYLNKSNTDLLWKLRNEPERCFRPLDLQENLITSGNFSRSIDLDFRLKLDWSDPSAEYSIRIKFGLETILKPIDKLGSDVKRSERAKSKL